MFFETTYMYVPTYQISNVWHSSNDFWTAGGGILHTHRIGHRKTNLFTKDVYFTFKNLSQCINEINNFNFNPKKG